MMQTILTLPYPIPKMKRLQHSSVPLCLGEIYRTPVYFAIVYNMVKTSQHLSYLEFLKEKFFELVVPYVL